MQRSTDFYPAALMLFFKRTGEDISAKSKLQFDCAVL
jgi:hypothetical protein